MKPFDPLLVAMQFLTRIPVPVTITADKQTIGRSLLCYPVVGLLLGLILAWLSLVLVNTPVALRAALVLAAWVLLTGALHLDGLADSADAWIGGIGNRKRTLAIMKDPYCGPAAVVALVVTLLIKFTALQSLDPENWWTLTLIPFLGRALIPLLLLTTPYVRPGGLGSVLATYAPRAGIVAVLAATAIVAIWASDSGLWLMVAAIVTFVGLRAMMVTRIGGTTGDTAGALIELSETAMLVTAVFIQG